MSTPKVVSELLARSNKLGAEPRFTNYAGGNTSAKGVVANPATGKDTTVLWVKGSGGDLGTLKEAGLAALDLEKFNYDSGGKIHANYIFPKDGRTFQVSLSPVMSEYKSLQPRTLRRAFIKTNKGVFVVSVTGNITEEKKSQILQNANYFSDQIK